MMAIRSGVRISPVFKCDKGRRFWLSLSRDKIRPVSIFIEAVACSVDDCLEAEAGGADRLELCSAMMVGGLTPSLGTLIDARAATPLPIVTMIRPRAGGFRYTPREFATMMRDAELAARHGADGLVFGILTADGRVDAARCQEFIDDARQIGVSQTTFHRAFDVTPDPYDAPVHPDRPRRHPHPDQRT